MLEQVEKHLERVLALVAKCPDHLQEKCFELLLGSLIQPPQPQAGVVTSTPPPYVPAPQAAGTLVDEPQVPAEVSGRFRTTAKRLSISMDQLAQLFDFHSDPFVYHALHVPGKSKAEQTRNVALLVGARSYLTTGQWVADLKEVRARCVDQNCYDNTNFRKYLEGGKPSSFSLTEDSARLTPQGIKAAETLLASVASESQ